VGFSVDSKVLARRCQYLRRAGLSGTDPWVVINGLNRLESWEVVRRVWEPLRGKDATLRVYPTTGGILIHTGASGWRERVQALADELSAQGYHGQISAPPVDLDDLPMEAGPCQALYTAHSQVPPVIEGPYSQYGLPIYRWSVPEPTNTRLRERIIQWTMGPDLPGRAEVWPIPVTTEDAADVLALINDGDQGTLAGWNADRTLIRRVVNRAQWGQTVWGDTDPGVDLMQRALDLADLLRECAPDLDYGFIRPAQPVLMLSPMMLTDTFWRKAPHLWADYTLDAFGIQLLTTSQLAKAHDLTNWTIEQVAADRYLVSAKNLEPWLVWDNLDDVRYERFPDPDLRNQARNDFGDMILTHEIRAAHPLQPPR